MRNRGNGIRSVRAVTLAVIVMIPGACSAEVPLPSAAIRDSAGVRIVENGERDWDHEAARLEGPLFRFGWKDEEPWLNSVTHGRILEDRRVVVADAGSATIYSLFANGTVERTVGGPGEGPGQFEEMTAMLPLPGDSLLVYDRSEARLSLFSGTGDFVGSQPWPKGPGVSSVPTAALPDGRLLFTPSERGWYDRDQPDGWVRGSVFMGDSRTGEADTVASVDHQLVRNVDGFVRETLTFARTVGNDGGWVSSRNDEPALLWFDRDGSLAQVAHWGERRALTADEREAYVDGRIEAVTSRWSRERLEEYRLRLEEAVSGWSERVPLFVELHPDPAGDVWMSEFPLQSERPRRYRLFLAEGTLAGWVRVPPRFQILDVRDGFLLGMEQDELDVQSVALYRVVPR